MGSVKKTWGLQFKLRRFSPLGRQKGGGLLLKFNKFPHRVANYEWVAINFEPFPPWGRQFGQGLIFGSGWN